MFLLPSLFTSINIGAGYWSITQTIDAISGNAQLHLDLAAIGILFAIPFDALDGRIARMTNTCSDFGKELDSLADVITFGVAPSLLAFVWGFHFLPDSINADLRQHLMQAGAFVCFLFLLSGASRLARFNISHDAQPRNPGRPGRKYFVGMPIPAAAGLLASSVHLCYGIPNQYWWIAIPWMILVGLTGFLMVSTWRFWSGKEINFSQEPSVPDAGADCHHHVRVDPLFQCCAFRHGSDVHVFGHMGAGGVFLVAPAAHKAARRLAECGRCRHSGCGSGQAGLNQIPLILKKSSRIPNKGCLCTRSQLPELLRFLGVS